MSNPFTTDNIGDLSPDYTLQSNNPSIPVADVPTMDVPTMDAPTMDVPTMDVPTMDAPGIDVPTIDVPTMDVPTMDVPTMDVPTMDAPDIDFPTMDAPVIDTPAINIESGVPVPIESPESMSFIGKIKDFIGKIRYFIVNIRYFIVKYNIIPISLLVLFVALLISIYFVHKNKNIGVEVENKKKTIRDKINDFIYGIYSFIKKQLNNISNLLYGRDVLTHIETKVEENEDTLENNTINKIIKKEVFNIKDNVFTYKESKDVCRAFDSEVASKKQVEMALENGANWCNYGWTKGGLALYPIQKNYYDQLKKSNSDKKNQCGYPGINGGKFNPNFKFGVNCYGVKPEDKVIGNKECKKPKDKGIDKDKLFINKFNCTDDSEFDSCS